MLKSQHSGSGPRRISAGLAHVTDWTNITTSGGPVYGGILIIMTSSDMHDLLAYLAVTVRDYRILAWALTQD